MSFSGLLRPLLPGLPIDEPTTPITGRSQWPRWQRVNLVEPQLPRLRKRPRMRRMLITYPHIEPLDNEIPANDPKAQAVVDRLQLPRRSTPAHDRETPILVLGMMRSGTTLGRVVNYCNSTRNASPDFEDG